MESEGSDRCMRSGSTISSASTFVSGSFDDDWKSTLSASSSVTAVAWDRTAQNQADRFVHEKGPQIHPIFSHLTPCEEQRTEKKSRKLKHDLSAPTDHFYHIIETYRSRTDGDTLLNDFNVRKIHTWDEVFRAASLAEEKYKRDEKRKFLKKLGRGAQSSAPAMSPWLELIPNGDYTSALCGGLKIAFNVANRIHEQRAQIFETFTDIPETIKQAEDRLEEWPNDEVLYDAASDLYLAVLKSIEAMIRWLMETPTWKKIGSVLRKPQSNMPADFGLKDVQSSVRKLSNRATALQSKAIARTDVNTQEVMSGMETVRISSQNTERLTVEMYPVLVETRESVKALGAVKDAHDGTVSFLVDQLKNSELQKAMQERRHKREMRRLKKENKALKEEAQRSLSDPDEEQVLCISQDHLLDLLEVFPDMPEQDLKKVIKQSKRSAPASQGRGNWLLQNARFQNWLTSGEAQGLTVNGNTDTHEKISSMSYVCALLIQSLEEMENAVTISFFCGLHDSDKDSLNGAAGLLRSFIEQLLEVYEFDLACIDPQYEQGLQSFDVEYLAHLFQNLVGQLPDDMTLFCIIDGISFYEKRRYGSEIQDVVRMLQELTENSAMPPIFKLLLTSPVMPKCAKAYFPSSNRLLVPTDAGNGQLLTAKQVKRQTSRRSCGSEEPPPPYSSDVEVQESGSQYEAEFDSEDEYLGNSAGEDLSETEAGQFEKLGVSVT